MRLTIVGRNPCAGGSECVIFGEIGADDRFRPVADAASLAAGGSWLMRAMRPGGELGDAPALVGWRERDDHCRTTGRLVMLSHNWSGVVQINDVGRIYRVDLYSETTRLALLDLVNGIVVDITALAETADGALALPALDPDTLERHIVESLPWFRFVERDPRCAPGPLRRALEAFRRPPEEALKRRLTAALLATLSARAPPPPPPPPPDTALRDEMRLLAAAVEGLALSARAEA